MIARLKSWWLALVDFSTRPIEIRFSARADRLERQMAGLAEQAANAELRVLAAIRSKAEDATARDLMFHDALEQALRRVTAVEATVEQLDARLKHAVVMLTGKSAEEIQAKNGAREPRTFTHGHRQ